MRRRITTVVAALALLAATAVATEAQSASANATATIDIPTVLFISVDNTNITFPTPTATEFEAGYVTSDQQSAITTAGNVQHDLTIQADASTFSGGSGSKPASDLVWSTSQITSSGDGTGLTTTAAAVQSALARGRHPDVTTVDYGILLDYATDAPQAPGTPATYTLNFTYTVVPN